MSENGPVLKAGSGGSVLPTKSDLEGSGPGTGMIFLVPKIQMVYGLKKERRQMSLLLERLQIGIAEADDKR